MQDLLVAKLNVSKVQYLFAFITLVLQGVVVRYSQTKPRLPQTVTEVFSQSSTHTEAAIISLAEAMPEDKYSFVPTNEAFRGVYTFAQQVKRVAADNYVDAAALLKERPPIDVGERENARFSKKQSRNSTICSGLLRVHAEGNSYGQSVLAIQEPRERSWTTS